MERDELLGVEVRGLELRVAEAQVQARQVGVRASGPDQVPGPDHVAAAGGELGPREPVEVVDQVVIDGLELLLAQDRAQPAHEVGECVVDAEPDHGDDVGALGERILVPGELAVALRGQVVAGDLQRGTVPDHLVLGEALIRTRDTPPAGHGQPHVGAAALQVAVEQREEVAADTRRFGRRPHPGRPVGQLQVHHLYVVEGEFAVEVHGTDVEDLVRGVQSAAALARVARHAVAAVRAAPLVPSAADDVADLRPGGRSDGAVRDRGQAGHPIGAYPGAAGRHDLVEDGVVDLGVALGPLGAQRVDEVVVFEQQSGEVAPDLLVVVTGHLGRGTPLQVAPDRDVGLVGVTGGDHRHVGTAPPQVPPEHVHAQQRAGDVTQVCTAVGHQAHRGEEVPLARPGNSAQACGRGVHNGRFLKGREFGRN